jgi:hypothetical protein
MEESMTLLGSSKYPWLRKITSSKFIGHLGTRPRKNFRQPWYTAWEEKRLNMLCDSQGFPLLSVQALILHGHELN